MGGNQYHFGFNDCKLGGDWWFMQELKSKAKTDGHGISVPIGSRHRHPQVHGR